MIVIVIELNAEVTDMDEYRKLFIIKMDILFNCFLPCPNNAVFKA